MHGKSSFHLLSACLSLSSCIGVPTTWLLLASGPRFSARLESVSAAAGDERLPASLSAPVPPGSQRPRSEWTSFMSCIRLARLTAASGGPPEEDARSRLCCQGLCNAISVNSASPGLPAGENKAWLCPSPPSLGGVCGERKVSRSGLVAWPPRTGTFHKVTFQGLLPPAALAAMPALQN